LPLARRRMTSNSRDLKMTKPQLYFLDTNAASAFIRGQDAGLVLRVREAMPRLRLSAVVWGELWYGMLKRPDRPRLRVGLERLRERIPTVEPFDERASEVAAEVRTYLATLKPNAQPIGAIDCLLAGHALSLSAGIVTGNVREFRRVPGLVVEDWHSLD